MTRALMRPPDDVVAPPAVEEAKTELRSLREQLGLAGAGVLVAGLAASAAGVAIALPVMGAGLGMVGILYLVPPTERGRWARRVLANWEEGRRIRDLDDPVSEDDPRLAAAGSMVERIADHAGEGAASTTVAGELHRLLYDSLEDLETVDLLRDAGRGTERSGVLQARADGLQRQVEERMDHALGTITDIFEAVLAHDSAALRRVLARAEEELRQLRAIEEVETLLAPGEEEQPFPR
jgi:hypothetical protein